MTKTKVKFSLPAEMVAGAENGILVGDFNNWNVQEGIYLDRTEDGSMRTELVLTEGKVYQYRYLLSDGRWVNDNNPKTWPTVHGITVENCLIEVPVSGVEIQVQADLEKAPAPKKVSAKKATVAKTKTAAPKKLMNHDFTKIVGISKQVAKLLQVAGIETYAALGKTSAKKLNEILEAAGPKFKLLQTASWPKQAKLAAAEKWQELELLQSGLKADK